MDQALTNLLSAVLGSAIYCFYGAGDKRLQAFYIFTVASLGGWQLAPAFSSWSSIKEQEACAFIVAIIIFPLSRKLLAWVIALDVAKIIRLRK